MDADTSRFAVLQQKLVKVEPVADLFRRLGTQRVDHGPFTKSINPHKQVPVPFSCQLQFGSQVKAPAKERPVGFDAGRQG